LGYQLIFAECLFVRALYLTRDTGSLVTVLTSGTNETRPSHRSQDQSVNQKTFF